MKRVMDLALAVPALLLLTPLLLALAVVVSATSPGGPIFWQERVGFEGRPFKILKLRTMRRSAEDEGQITIGRDPRVTRIGALLRATKLDELPQLLNVVAGDMSLVGPRPEVPKYVAHWPAVERDLILSVRPGITDPASIDLRRESELLAVQNDPEKYYVDVLIPKKVAAYAAYVQSQSVLGDFRILLATLSALVRRSAVALPRTPSPDSPISTQVSGQISFRPLLAKDAPAAAVLHAEAFPSFFLSDLGVRFLRELYIAFAEDSRCIAVVALQGEAIVAVAAGASNHEGFLSSLVRRRFLRFTLALTPRVIRKPALIPRLIRRFSGTDFDVHDHPAVLSSICVSRRSQGNGIGMALLAEWCNRLAQCGANRVHLTTDADDNDRTLDFYQAAGWKRASTFTTREGRRMHVLTIEFAVS